MKIITTYLSEERTFEKTDSVKALVFRGPYILLLRRQEGTPGAGQWDLPGGCIEKGESKEDALKREVYEETGLKIDAIKYKEQVHLKIPEAGIDSNMNLFTANAKGIDVILKPSNWKGSDGKQEHNEYRWCEYKEEVETLPMLDQLKKAVLKHLSSRT